MSKEKKRVLESISRDVHWKKWGPYLSERQWGTIREDYSVEGQSWEYFTYDDAKHRTYRWGEDGIGGISDTHQRLCFAFTFWNGRDSHLKERLFGVSNSLGNHGEDVKEVYYHLDNTPTHSYMKYLYKYPQQAFPYDDLVEENSTRDQTLDEYELMETGIFDEDRYFDIEIEYAKDSSEDLYISLTAINRSDECEILHVLPTIWFRNTWLWKKSLKKPRLRVGMLASDFSSIVCEDESLGEYTLYGQSPQEMLFTENETNMELAFGRANHISFTKEAFHKAIVDGDMEAVNPEKCGTKGAMHYSFEVPSKGSKQLFFRLTNQNAEKKPLANAKKIVKSRKEECDEYYDDLSPPNLNDDVKNIYKQALSGMLWNKMFYHFVIDEWLEGDEVLFGEKIKRNPARNLDWLHLYNDDILSVPDKWEYPAFYSWDTAFHCIVYAILDPAFAKRQLMLLTREWYMHPNGQLPAYEWNFNDVNPPVHAWATWRVFKIESKYFEKTDHSFLESVYQKLLMNFTWWVNREDESGRNVFKGGFLGLDNISIFNRSETLPTGGELYQSDATSWMGMYCLNMLRISFELAKSNKAYEDMASKFYEHFLHIAKAINFESDEIPSLWDEEDGFYYDILMLPDGECRRLRVRSLVGLMPLLAVETIEQECLDKLSGFTKRMEWFQKNRSGLCKMIGCMKTPGEDGRKILTLVNKERLVKILKYMLDENEFLGPFGIRSLSKIHEEYPYELKIGEHFFGVDYAPGTSTNLLFGGNSNWRGPVWMPINYLLIESLQKYHHYYGDDFKVECPTGSGNFLTLWEVASEISRRLLKLFTHDEKGQRPIYNQHEKLQKDPFFKDNILFYEYFHADKGTGLGASHQTGWTGIVAKLIRQLSDYKQM